jgi:hypothetical protein
MASMMTPSAAPKKPIGPGALIRLKAILALAKSA